jgi:hypothetical protein
MNVMNHKLESVSKELENERKEFADLQEKYADKVRYDKFNPHMACLKNRRQKRKIEELYSHMKENAGSSSQRTSSVPAQRAPQPPKFGYYNSSFIV